MEGDNASKRAKTMCSLLACGCRRICACSIKETCKQHPSDSEYWSSTTSRPWISWSGVPDKDKAKYFQQSGGKKRDAETELPHDKTVFPTQSRRYPHNEITSSVSYNPILPPSHSIVGHPSLRIYKFRLPTHLLHLLDHIVDGCQKHAGTLPTGWTTYLYSLTKQDIALRDVPGLYEASRPVIHFVKRYIERVYEVETIRIDRNQPHVLKYSAEDGSKHTGVELHHDKCDLTANIMLSRSSSYVGGGTYFPDASTTVRLEFGEFLIHPGNLVHGGVDISRGTRHIMVMFTHTE